MGLSGFLYLAIVVGWAVYLVPFALKRYDEATRNRSIDRFSSAMRVLGSREDEAAASGHADANVPLAPPEAGPGPTVPPQAREAQRTAARVAVRRRRRVLLTLLLATVATAVAAGLGALPPWAPAVPGALVVLWLVVCRGQARREHAVRPAYPADPADQPGQPGQPPGAVPGRQAVPAAEADASAEMLDAAAVDAGADVAESDVAAETDGLDVALAEVPADDEPTVVLSREDLAGEEYAGSGSLWDPVPVTLPTYVHKPRAPRTIRTIDLGAEGGQSSPARSAESAIYTHRTHVVEQDSREEAEDAGAQQPQERSGPTRRAVGE